MLDSKLMGVPQTYEDGLIFYLSIGDLEVEVECLLSSSF